MCVGAVKALGYGLTGSVIYGGVVIIVDDSGLRRHQRMLHLRLDTAEPGEPGQRLIEAPPGLGGRDKKTNKHPVDDMLKKHWASLSEDVKKALQSAGIDYTPEPELQSLENVLKAHLQSLPGEVKEAVENLLTPVKQEPKDVTTKLKATVGELRQLSNKKAGLQKRVDNAKDQYKLLLDELKVVQEQIDKEQQQLSLKHMPSS